MLAVGRSDNTRARPRAGDDCIDPGAETGRVGEDGCR